MHLSGHSHSFVRLADSWEPSFIVLCRYCAHKQHCSSSDEHRPDLALVCCLLWQRLCHLRELLRWNSLHGKVAPMESGRDLPARDS